MKFIFRARENTFFYFLVVDLRRPYNMKLQINSVRILVVNTFYNSRNKTDKYRGGKGCRFWYHVSINKKLIYRGL